MAQQYMTESGHAEFHSSVPLHSFSGVSDNLVGLIDIEPPGILFYRVDENQDVEIEATLTETKNTE